MSFPKGLAIAFLSFLLFLSLFVFGLALTLNMTALSADFVTSKLDKLDISSLVEDAISQQSAGEELPEEFRTALVDAMPRLEPLLKEQIVAATYPIYDYLKGEEPELDLVRILQDTILNQELVISLLDELDLPALAEGFLDEQFIGEIPQDVALLIPDMSKIVAETLAELEPWIKEQVEAVIPPISDYILGKSASFYLIIPLDTVKETIRNNLWEAISELPPETLRDILRETLIASPSPELRTIIWGPFLESLSPELSGLPPAELEPYFNEFLVGLPPEELDPYLDELIAAFPLSELEAEFNRYFEEFTRVMPSGIELSEDLLDPEIPAQVAEALSDAEERLGEARQYIGIFQTGFAILIVFILLMMAAIILIRREVRGSSRILGIILLSYGALELTGIFIIKNLAQSSIPWADIPLSIQEWLRQLVRSSLAPLQTLSIVLIVTAVALLTVSFIYQRRQSRGEPGPENPTAV